MSTSVTRKTRSTQPVVKTQDGRRVSLNDLPLVVFYLSCGHTGREYAVQKADIIFCPTCLSQERVTRTIE